MRQCLRRLSASFIGGKTTVFNIGGQSACLKCLDAISQTQHHTATGGVALLLMLAHAVWATIVLINRAERPIRTFHRVSITVWAIWLIPFVTGMILGRHRGH